MRKFLEFYNPSKWHCTQPPEKYTWHMDSLVKSGLKLFVTKWAKTWCNQSFRADFIWMCNVAEPVSSCQTTQEFLVNSSDFTGNVPLGKKIKCFSSLHVHSIFQLNRPLQMTENVIFFKNVVQSPYMSAHEQIQIILILLFAMNRHRKSSSKPLQCVLCTLIL